MQQQQQLQQQQQQQQQQPFPSIVNIKHNNGRFPQGKDDLKSKYNRHQAILGKHSLFPLIVPLSANENLYTREYLLKCFLKALENIKYEDAIENIDRSILQKVFFEFGIFIQNWQLSEGYFFATFDFGDEELNFPKENEDEVNEEFAKLESKFYEKYKSSNANKRPNTNNTNINNKKRNNKFNLPNFITWFQKAIIKMRSYTQIEIEQYERAKTRGGKNDNPAMNFNRLNQSMDQPRQNDLSRSKTPKPNLENNAALTKNNNYKELYNLLEKKRMLKLEYPDIDITKRHISIPKIHHHDSNNKTKTGFKNKFDQSMTSSFNDYQNIKKIIGNKIKPAIDEGEDRRTTGYKLLLALDEEIKRQIKTCFQDFIKENPNTKKMIYDYIKQIHASKLKDDEETGVLYSDIIKHRIEYAQETNKLKAFEELVLLMREQDSALEAARLYDLLYTNDEILQRELKNIHIKRKVKGDAEYRLQNLLKSKLS